MRVAVNFNDAVHAQWKELRKQLHMGTTELASFLVRGEFERRNGKLTATSAKQRRPGRPTMGPIEKEAKLKVPRQIALLLDINQGQFSGKQDTSFYRGAMAMQALMDAGLYQKALDMFNIHWWSSPLKIAEPDWQSWLKESEAE